MPSDLREAKPEDPLERSLPGATYGIVLLLLLATFVFMAAGFSGSWVPLVTVLLQGVTLLAVLQAAGVGPRIRRLTALLVLAAFAGAIAATFFSSGNVQGGLFLLNVLLVGAAPVVIGRSIWQRRIIDVHTVLGALCIYVIIGMLWAFLYNAMGALGSQPFFVQTHTATTADYLYFSYVTQTTVGYGDFTAASGLGRALAVIEALTGQIFLVTVVALLVSNLGRARRFER
jgi:voltage-gated potassium channel Kch